MLENPIKSITESGDSDTSVRHSTGSKSGKEKANGPSLDQLVAALEKSNKLNEQLVQKVETLELEIQESKQKSSNPQTDAIKALTEAIAAAAQPKVVGPTEMDNFNKTSDFKNTKAMVDGGNMMEAQQALASFRNEVKKPISIPKSLANFLGPNLNVTVNGIRVSIPCDGKTYYINETHWEHARERMAKVDIQEATPDQIETINA
jgi:hypothetical protein